MTDLDDVVNELRDVKSAVEAIKGKWNTAQWIGAFLLWTFLSNISGAVWHSKLRYSFQYEVPLSKVMIEEIPSSQSCAFIAAPVGEKYCHHDWEATANGSPNFTDVYVNRPRVEE